MNWLIFRIRFSREIFLTTIELLGTLVNKKFKKHILVAGGAGFLGSHLIDRLIGAGNSVLCVDNFTTGSQRNIRHHLGSPDFRFIQHDIINPLNVEEDVDEIYNLACPASPENYQVDPIQTMKTSVFGAVNLLDLAANKNAKILQASTSEVYGDPLVHPQVEAYWGNVNPIGVRSCYDEGKRAAETLFFDHHRQKGTKVKVARIFNTYGPRMDPNDGRVVSNFVVQALKNEPITMYGDGTQTRSFCYVDDLIEVLIRFMASEDSIIGPLNTGNPNEFTVNQLASKVLALTKSTSQLVYTVLPSDDPTQRRPDIQLAKTVLDWSPRIELDQGLTKTIAYYRELIEPKL